MDNKWFAKSLTLWGLLITTISGIVPFLSSLIGWDINPADIMQIGEAGTKVINAIGTLAGLVMSIIGRLRARTGLTAT